MTAPLSGQYAAYPGIYSAQGYATAGLISDYSTKSEQRFLKRDANGDGALSFDEFSANQVDWKGRPLDSVKLQEKFHKMDANGDGKVTREEMQAAHAQRRALKHQQQALAGAAGVSASASGTLPPGAYLQPTVSAAQPQVAPYYSAGLAPGVNYTG